MTIRPRGSLAAQLQPRIVVIIAVMAVVMGVATVLATGSIMYGQLDQELDSTQGRQRRSMGRAPGDRIPGADKPGLRFGTVVALQLPDGSARGAVIDPDDNSLSDAGLAALLAVPADGRKHTVTVPGEGQYRVEASITSAGKAIIGLPTGEIDRTLLWLAVFAGGMSLLAVSATALITRTVVGAATRPLESLTNTADEVSSLDLEHGEVAVPRVAGSHLPDDNEVTRLGNAFNRMLGRVEGALSAREASERKLRRFVADASHELRNPLASIRGYAELAERSPEGSAHALGRISSESQRMTKLVNDLLLLARLDADAETVTRPVDAVEVVLNAVSDAQASGRGHRWRLDLPEKGIEVLADPDQLHQVMVNLLSNARTHTPVGTTVTTSVAVEDAMAVIRVSDDGPGIPAETLPRVFERFTRADDSRAHSSAHSTGLGLAIVRAVVDGFGGDASVDSHPGRTTLTIRLPLA